MKNKLHDIDITQHVTRQELQDYAEGVLGNEEMYRLELHLNECALCSDALDGLLMQPNAKEALLELNKLPFAEPKPKASFNYMAIAAGLASIAIFGLAFWLLSKEPTQEAIVQTVSKSTAQQPITEQKPASLQPKETTQDSLKPNQPQELLIAENGQTPPPKEQELQEATAIKGASKNKIEEQPGVQISTPQEVVVADDKSDEEPLAEMVMAPLPEQDKSQNVGNDDSENLLATTRSKRAAKTTILPNQKQPLPKGGMAAFKKYLIENLEYPAPAREAKIKGTVLLELTIAPNGTIKNIRVSKGLGYGCDEEAMRLVMSGPSWTPKVESGQPLEAKTQVKIKFKP